MFKKQFKKRAQVVDGPERVIAMSKKEEKKAKAKVERLADDVWKKMSKS